MHVIRIQYQWRMPWPSNPSGFYYWTNQFYGDEDNPPSTSTFKSWFEQFFANTLGNITDQNRVRVFDPALSNTVVSENSLANEANGYPIETGYSPFDTVLLYWLADGRKVGYSRLRIPVQESDQVNGWLHPDLRDVVLANALYYLLNGKACSRLGVPITGFYVDPRVRGWQFRHGTKRRERKVFGPP